MPNWPFVGMNQNDCFTVSIADIKGSSKDVFELTICEHDNLACSDALKIRFWKWSQGKVIDVGDVVGKYYVGKSFFAQVSLWQSAPRSIAAALPPTVSDTSETPFEQKKKNQHG